MLREFFIKWLFGGAQGQQGQQAEMANWGLDASRMDDSWSGQAWASLVAKQEVDSWDLRTIWQRARMLYYNCPPIRHAVQNMVSFTGELTPLPCTSDEEWNELARAAFLARVKNPFLFDAAGRLNFSQAQDFLETCAIVDGDVAMMPCVAADGGALFAFYRAPQIGGGGEQGVEVDKHNRPVAYYIVQEDKPAVRVEAWKLVMYSHNPDPTALRHESELVAAIRHGQDIRAIVGYSKQGIKLAAQFGLIETSDVAASVGSLDMSGVVGRKNAVQTSTGQRYLADTGISITSLPPGHRMTTIQDQRPSQQVMEFIEFLVQNIAWAVGLDKEMLYYTEKLASSGTRFNLEKLKRWQQRRRVDREIICNRIWTQVIACEIAAGRLRPCRDRKWRNVTWAPPRDMTIDLGRETRAHLDLMAKGLEDVDGLCLSLHGKPYRRLLEEKAYNIAAAKKIAAEYGVEVGELIEASAGATVAPGVAPGGEPTPGEPGEPAPGKGDKGGKHPDDDDPEE